MNWKNMNKKFAMAMKNHMLPIVFILIAVSIPMGIYYPWAFIPLKSLLPLALFMMLFKPFFYINMKKIKENRGSNIKYLTIVTLFYVSIFPILTFLLFHLFYNIWPNIEPAFLAGIVLISLAPIPSSAPAFTGLAKGNVSLTTIGVVWTFLLSLLSMPIYSSLILHTVIKVPILSLINSLIIFIIIPLTIAQLLRYYIIHKKGIAAMEKLKLPLTEFSLLGLYLMVFIVFGLNARLIVKNPTIIVIGAVIMNAYFLLRMMMLYYTGKALKFGIKESIALLYSSGSNMTLATALAIATFGPLAAVAVSLGGPFSDMILMILFANYFKNWDEKNKKGGD